MSVGLEGRGIVVTGGGSGIGAATCRLLALKGATVGVLDRNADAARAVAEEIGGLALACDVGASDQVDAAIARADAVVLQPPRERLGCACEVEVAEPRRLALSVHLDERRLGLELDERVAEQLTEAVVSFGRDHSRRLITVASAPKVVTPWSS